MDFSATATAFLFLMAAVVADFKAVKDEISKRTAGVFTALGAAFTAFFLVYADKIVIK